MKKRLKQLAKIRKGPLCLLVIYLIELFAPTTALALTGGPSQPEVQGFTPIDTSDMVSLFTGDFSYNIPLLDVDGYPINIAYASGITTDQEASWVGLGWSLNTGVVNRSLRGLPDDFDGDLVEKEFNIKENKTWGVTTGAPMSFEVFGTEVLSVAMSLGIKYNNFAGYSASFSLTPSLGPSEDGKMPHTASLGISASSDEGASIQPELSMTYQRKVEYPRNRKWMLSSLGISLGGAFNSRHGFSSLSVNVTPGMQTTESYRKQNRKFEESGIEGMGDRSAVNKLSHRSLTGNGVWNFTVPSFSSVSTPDTKNIGFSGKFNLGISFAGIFSALNLQGFYSRNYLATTSISNPAFGYLNSQNGNTIRALHDYTRENDASFDEYSPTISYPNFTYDFFNASAQGFSGSFRPVRSDIGNLYQPQIKGDPDLNVNIELELGFGAGAHVGGAIGINRTTSESRNWHDAFVPKGVLNFSDNNTQAKYERVYFKEAGEKSVDKNWQMFANNGSSLPVRVGLNESAKFSVSAAPWWSVGGTTSSINDTKRSQRDRRTQVFSYLNNKYAKDFAIASNETEEYSEQPDHLIGEITTLAADGKRYIFGKALYNNVQYDVNFAVGSTIEDSEAGREFSHASGLVAYTHNGSVQDNSTSNKLGIDNYFERTKTPKYAHSFMLTAILSSDYIDSDNIQGPSDDDLGSWTKFEYEKVNGYKWRSPLGDRINDNEPLASDQFVANYMEGLRSKTSDDKGNYTYGEKDLAYLKKIETKNYICVFETEERDDALGVIDEDGRVDASIEKRMRYLKEIKLYSKAEAMAVGGDLSQIHPIKTVHFVYTYELCKGIPNSINASTGKLTLREIYFTYLDSQKAKFSSYKFNYAYSSGLGFDVVDATNEANDNPDYNLKAYDRWGNYKPNIAEVNTGANDYTWVNNSEDPFTIQNRNITDNYVSSWTLKEILLPSGGAIRISYESDDYAYVQNKQACELYRIVGTSITGPVSYNPESPDYQDIIISEDGEKNAYIFIELPRDGNQIIGEPSDYFDGNPDEDIFIKGYAKFNPQSGNDFYEYVPGYYRIQEFEFVYGNDGKEYARALLKPQSIKDNDNEIYNPISISGLQFGRKYFSKELLAGQPNPDNGNFKDILLAIGDAFAAFREFFKAPNKILYNNNNGRKIMRYKSMIRLKNQSGHKLGGGLRVKKVESFDDWKNMTNQNGETMFYGQEYKYELEDGRSSGVATYEPQIGGEDNPFKKPLPVVAKRRGVPDERYFVEEPLGESFFPPPSVGYSRVEVRSIQHEGVTRNATGKVVHEFYTAKDFPTIASRTELEKIRHKPNAFSLRTLLKLTAKDYSTASQGICVEVNDMHGKERKTIVYAESVGENAIISSVEYKYKQSSYGDAFRLENTTKVINSDGSLQDATIGLFYELYNDTQEQTTFSWGADLSGNVDVIVLPFIALPIPTVKPGFTREHTMFRSTSTTKVIQRFGLIEEIIATDDGSEVRTSNLAYDAETGEVLLTEVNNNYDDHIYQLNFPAYWKYREMGGAYQNIDYTRSMGFDAEGKYMISGARNFYVEGDELALTTSSGANNKRGWVVEVADNFIKVIDKIGNPVTGAGFTGRIIRSGYRNMQAGTMASITTKSNPINLIAANNFARVLQASAIEYTNEWLTDCECYTEGEAFTTTNPYVLGIKGYWKPTKSYLFLTDRTQTDRNDNSNIRNDGEFTSFDPFYQVDGAGKWNAHYPGWTYTSEVTQFSPHGNELENRDALGRYSAAKFGYRQTLATAVGANTKYSELGYEGFEYLTSSFCGDNDFNIVVNSENITDLDAHTGMYSLRVNSQAPTTISSYVPSPCAIGDCALRMEIVPQLENLDIITISGGTPGYQIEWNYLIGSPLIEPWQGNQLRVTGDNWMIVVTVTDAEGNIMTVEFEKLD